MATRKRAAATTAEEIEAATQGADNNVDKIRDILFGGQMKDYERRFVKLEEKLTQEANRLAQDMEARIDSLDKFMRRELERRTEQLQQERKERIDALKSLDAELQKVNDNLVERLEQLDRNTQAEISETRQEFHDEVAILQTRLREQHDALQKELENESESLRQDKVSRDSLANLFSEVALRLNGEFNVPDAS